MFSLSPCKSLDLRGEFYIVTLLTRFNARITASFGKGSVSLREMKR